jgi:hypothetical protein
MTTFNRRSSATKSRVVVVAAGWLIALGLMALPAAPVAAVHRLALGLLRPALSPLASLRDAATQHLGPWSRSAWSDRRELTQQIDQLQQQVRALHLERDQTRAQQPQSVSEDLTPSQLSPLLQTRVTTARVLGMQARALLASRSLIEAPAALAPGALVIDDPGTTTWLDVGQDAQLATGARVIAAGRVWGQVHEVSPHVATVRRVTERGFRDLVEIRNANGSNAVVPQGILEGVGQGLCRIRFVETRFPLSVGDRVFAAERAALGRGELLYGEIVRAEAPRGGSHWELWMRPSANGPWPETVGVCSTDLNPQRLAQQPTHKR